MDVNKLNELVSARIHESGYSLPDDDEARRDFPNLWLFLTARYLPDNYVKEPANMTIRLGLAQWIVELSDPGLEVGLTTCTRKLSMAVPALEEAILRTDAPWRPWKGSAGKIRRLNKKTVAE